MFVHETTTSSLVQIYYVLEDASPENHVS